ncbi:MAG: PHP domain-containing protein [Christensenellales bacterium]
MKADLHLHSTASDGTLEPGELVALAAEQGFTHLALTDHDSVDGLARATDAARDCGVTLIPGVELSCGAQKEIHILGYGFDPYDERVLEFCRTRTMERQERAAKMVRQLCENGVEISLDRVMELARGVVARPHVARVLVEAGYANSVSSAFDKYLLPGKCGYVPKAEVKVAEAAKLIAGAGGVAVLAHPMELKMGEMTLESLVHEWHGQGLAGIEVYHPSAANNSLPFLLHLAEREGMLVTGGSDFHGPQVRQSCIGDGLDRWTTAEADVQKLMNRIGL